MASPPSPFVEESIAQSPLFRSLSEKEIASLVKQLPRERFDAGQRLIAQGAPGSKAYLLVEGRALIAVQKAGVPLKIMLQRAPALFGIIELAKELPCLGDVIALDACTCVVLDRGSFLQLLQRNHQVCINVILFLCEELYQTAKDLRVRLFGKIEHIVANALRYYGLIYGEKRQYGVLIRKEINKSELATILGVARRSVLRAMDELEAEGLVKREGAYLVVPDFDALGRKADECWTESESAAVTSSVPSPRDP